ncbi:MAG: HTTM domain-containing protein, partial [Planctomycetota bacterium]
MSTALRSTRDHFGGIWQAWNQFWFTPVDPATLSLIRLLAGGMLFYTHLIWSLDLAAFLGPQGWIPADVVRDIKGDHWSMWSVFFTIKSTWLLWTTHLLALATMACLAVGLFSRIAAVLAYVLAVSYAHRITPGAFFGLDKTNCMLAMYLMLGPCGARYSLDRLWRLRRGDVDDPPKSVSANVALRLIQVHLCVMYLFTALAKLEGENWKAGTAVWWA